MSHIKLFIVDVDGVLTNGNIWFDHEGREYKSFHVQDGFGLKRLMKAGVEIAIISGRNSPCVDLRMKELGIQRVYQGIEKKRTIYDALLDELKLTKSEVACIGDDEADLEIMGLCGLSISVENAVEVVKEKAHFCTERSGGNGAVREACDLILSAKLEGKNASKDTFPI